MIKVLFMGSGIFAVPVLKELLNLKGFEVVGVVTQPDKPAGRKQELKPSPVKQYLRLENAKLKLFQPAKLRLDAQEILNSSQPDLVLVASYGQMVPNIVLEAPKYKAINIHGSLLPQLRGAVPVQMAILQGLSVTGVTFQVMAPSMDTGDMLAKFEYQISPQDNSETLMYNLSVLASQNLAKVLNGWVAGKITPIKQDEEQATYCYVSDLSSEKAIFDSTYSSRQIIQMVKAFYPSGAYTKINVAGKDLILKVFNAQVVDLDSEPPLIKGLFKLNKQLYFSCSDGCLQLIQIQLEGKKILQAKDYLWLAT